MTRKQMVYEMVVQDGIMARDAVIILPMNTLEISDVQLVNAALDLGLDPRDLLGAEIAPFVGIVQQARQESAWNIAETRFDLSETSEALSDDEIDELVNDLKDLSTTVQEIAQREGE